MTNLVANITSNTICNNISLVIKNSNFISGSFKILNICIDFIKKSWYYMSKFISDFWHFCQIYQNKQALIKVVDKY